MKSRKIQPKNRTVAEQGEDVKPGRKLTRLGEKAAAAIGGKTEGIAKPKRSPEEQEKINRRFLSAIANGNLDLVRQLFRAGADVEARDEDGVTALMFSAENGKGEVEITRFLLENGADVNAKDPGGETALGFAVIHASMSHGKTEIIQLLREHGAKLEPHILGHVALMAKTGLSKIGSSDLYNELVRTR